MVDYGDVPTWLAFAGALVAAFYAHRAYRLEVNRDRESERLRRVAREQEQASRVSAWVDSRPSAMSVVVCLNASELPIYDVTPLLYGPDAQDEEDFVELLAWHVVPPGQTLDVETESLWIAEDLRCAITFTDSQDRDWIRDRFGTLSLR